MARGRRAMPRWAWPLVAALVLALLAAMVVCAVEAWGLAGM